MTDTDIKKMIVVGLTGPTGAGKSEVAGVWRERGFGLIMADELARRAVEPGSDCLRELAAEFSEEILRPDGSLDRRELARRAFSEKKRTERLNAITHPYILALAARILEEMARDGTDVAVMDAPQLFESGADGMCDLTVAVLAPAEQRLARIMARDGLDEAAARARMAAQLPDAYFRERATVWLENTGDVRALRDEAAALAERIQGGDYARRA